MILLSNYAILLEHACVRAPVLMSNPASSFSQKHDNRNGEAQHKGYSGDEYRSERNR